MNIKKPKISFEGLIEATFYVGVNALISTFVVFLLAKLTNIETYDNFLKLLLKFFPINNFPLDALLTNVLMLLGVISSYFWLKHFRRYVNTVGFSASNIITSSLLQLLLLTVVTKLFIPEYFTKTLTFLTSMKPYLSTYFFYVILGIILYFIIKLKLMLSEQVDDNFIDIKVLPKRFYYDRPIKSLNDDILNRRVFIESLSQEINRLELDSSFVYGLQGSWGEGKTSILNILAELLGRKYKKNKNIILQYDPWFFEGQKDLLQGFLRDFELKINENYIFPGLTRFLRKYGEIILYPLFNKLSLSNKTLNLFMSEETLNDLKEKIIRMLRSLNRKIVVIVDNIDRLDKNEILEMFKLIKLVSDFPNTVFILAYDQSVVRELISNKDFSEKIIQKVVIIPKTGRQEIKIFILSSINKMLSRKKLPKEKLEKFSSEFNQIYNSNFASFFPTLRKVKRYINSLRGTLSSSLIYEVNLKDIFLVEVIKVFYPKIFNDIWNAFYYYKYIPWSQDPFSQRYLSSLHLKKENFMEKVKEHISKLLLILKDENERQEVRSLLMELFFPIQDAFGETRYDYSLSAEEFRYKQRLVHPVVFDKYFLVKSIFKGISDKEVIDFISQINSHPDSGIKTLIHQKFSGTILKKNSEVFLGLFELFSRDIVERRKYEVAQGIYSFVTTLEELKADFQMQVDYARVILKIINSVKNNANISKYCEKLLTGEHLILSSVLFKMLAQKQSKYEKINRSIDLKKVGKIFSDHLEKKLIKKNIFRSKFSSQSVFILEVWSLASRNKNLITNYVIGLSKKRPKYLSKLIFEYFQNALEVPSDSIPAYVTFSTYYNSSLLYKASLALDLEKQIKNDSEKKTFEIFKARHTSTRKK